ncbi:MAG: lipoyl synthase [Acidimicrobiales bacterium]
MLRARWLGRVRFADAHALQRALFASATDPYLLLLEHPHVYTLGLRGSMEHVLTPPGSVGAELVRTDRGGDVTYHGPGQLVGYPILSVPTVPGATPAYVRSVEQLMIDACADLGLASTGRLDGFPGVWVDPGGDRPRKICAVGVRRSRGRTMHGFAFNVDPDLSFFDHIVPCGIRDKAVTSLAAEGVRVEMAEVVAAVVARATVRWGGNQLDWAATGSAATPAVASPASGLPITARKPDWLRVKVQTGPEYRRIRQTMRSLDLVTVCEEAGCPNIFECWNDGTATFMINGDRCTRACGFCLVDTRRPAAPDPEEPEHLAEAVARMGLAHAVITAVARDDLPDGGAGAFAAAIAAVRRRCPGTTVEVLVPDCKGDPAALATIFDARPDVLNHNLETVARLQRAVRPSASYARSLSVLGRARAAGLRTKSGLMVGLGETADEVRSAMADMRNVGVEILTVGQYLRPSGDHLPVARWWNPEELDDLRRSALGMGFASVEASPLARSSYHARQAAAAVG